MNWGEITSWSHDQLQRIRGEGLCPCQNWINQCLMIIPKPEWQVLQWQPEIQPARYPVERWVAYLLISAPSMILTVVAVSFNTSTCSIIIRETIKEKKEKARSLECDKGAPSPWPRPKSSHEPGKKTQGPLLSIESWLFNRDPDNGFS